MLPSLSLSDRPRLRNELRARRRALSVVQQKVAARALARRLAMLPALKHARRIALYWPMDGEIDPRFLARVRNFSHHGFYLPILRRFPGDTLRFARWHAGMALHRNRFGIPEPVGRAHLSAKAMDAVLLPLTGFDAQGNRLGMGGGFYDRTLAFKRHSHCKPLLIGVAHACQQMEKLAVASWDIPLTLVVTDRKTFR